jgi:radical SAM superfamily enzyme YgiQ (UPF0313 family)
MIIDDAGGLVFRPPSEARSFILRVTIGCSHNTCRFCDMYKASKFRIRPMEEIEGIIERGAYAMPFIRRIFLADGDALVLPTDKLVAIMQKCYEKFPNLNRIGAYATPADLVRKTPEELKRLREAGLAIVYMGIESGDDGVLKLVDKGTTAALTIEAGKKALAAGMKLSTMILLGSGRPGTDQGTCPAYGPGRIGHQPDYAQRLVAHYSPRSTALPGCRQWNVYPPDSAGLPPGTGHDPAPYGNDQALHLPQ